MENCMTEINKLFIMYNLKLNEKEEFLGIINPIIVHEEFIKRLDSKKYPHHGKISLGSHIVSDAIETYIISKKKNKKKKKVDIELAVIIAMFHDLYELPWQNNKINKRFLNKHGFAHPIEAVINAYMWYPEYFKDLTKARVIIDGIIHHMYPFPVRAININFDNTEINNLEKIDFIDDEIKNLIIESSVSFKKLPISFRRSIYKEGRVMSRADKIVSIRKELKSIKSLKACITGKNKELIKNDK